MLIENLKPKWHSLQILTQSPGAAPNECRPSDRGICGSKWSMAEHMKKEGMIYDAEVRRKVDDRLFQNLSPLVLFTSLFFLY